MRREQLGIALLLPAVLLLTYLLYLPGAKGGFYFDDYANINALATFDVHGVSWRGIAFYLDASASGPLKRPLSMLSFLIDDNTWPSSPVNFKRTNIKLHLLAGVALFYFLWRLALLLKLARAEWLALLGAGVWLLHPYNVSTVLYCVQRMTILAALFSFAALGMYCHGRQRLVENKTAVAWSLLLGAMACIALSVLSKENGALTFWLLLLIEAVFLRSIAGEVRVKGWSLYQRALILLPALLLGGWMLVQAYSIFVTMRGVYGPRDFTAYERLYTQAHVVWEYLSGLLIPHLEMRGLMAGAYPVSKSLFSPVSTVFAALALLALVAAAIALRKKYPVIALAILFFFVGHALESTYIGLELYFEHRNYLPSALLFFALAHSAQRVPWSRWLHGAWVLALVVFLWQRAQLWGNDPLLIAMWAEKNPASSRAQLYAADAMLDLRYVRLGRGYIERALAAEPDNPLASIQAAIFNCRADLKIPVSEQSLLEARIRKSPFSLSTFRTLQYLVETKYEVGCREWSYEDLNRLIDAFGATLPRVPGNQNALSLWLRGYNAILAKNANEAAHYFGVAAENRSDIAVGLGESAMLASQGAFHHALKHLDVVEKRNREINGSQHSLAAQTRFRWIDSEIARLRKLYEDGVAMTWKRAE